jgi:hypothetical protein
VTVAVVSVTAVTDASPAAGGRGNGNFGFTIKTVSEYAGRVCAVAVPVRDVVSRCRR